MARSRFHKTTIGLETVYGDGGATPTPVPLFATTFPEDNPTIYENPVFPGSLGRNVAYIGLNYFRFNGSFWLKGSGVAGTAPEIAKLLKIAGLGETLVAVTSATYSPVNSAHDSAGLTVNIDGVDYVIPGTRISNLKIPIKAGEPVTCEAEFQGLYASPTAVAYSAPTFADAAVVAPVATAMALTIGGASFMVPEINLEIKNVVPLIKSVNAANRGIAEMPIMGREYGGKLVAIRDANNDIEWWTNYIGSTEVAVASTGFGAAGNLIAPSFSKLQIVKIKPMDYEGMPAYDIDFRINLATTLAGEFSLQFR
jgi:hypothetical protein